MVSGVHWGFWEGLNTLLFMMHLEHCPGTWYMLYYWHWCCWSCLKVKVLVAQSCPALCNPMGCSPPGSSVPRILQAGILEWVAIPFSRGSSWPRDQTQVSHITGRFFTVWATWEDLIGTSVMEKIWRLFKKLYLEMPYELVIPLQSYIWKNHVFQKIHAHGVSL